MILKKRTARYKRQRDSFLPFVQLLADVAAIYLVLLAVFWVRFLSGLFPATLSSQDYPVYYNIFHITVITSVFFLRANALYGGRRFFTFGEEIFRIFKSVFSAVILLTAASFFVRDFSFSRTFLISVAFFLCLGVIAARFLLETTVMAVDKKRKSFSNVLMIGCEESAAKLLHFYRKNLRYGRKVVGFLDERRPVNSKFENLPVFGKPGALAAVLKDHRQIHEVVLASQNISSDLALQIISFCEKEMVHFQRIADMYDLISAKMSVSYAGGISIVSFTDSPLSNWENRLLKRSLDFVLSGMALVVLSPALLLIALAVKKSSQGPVFYRQERIGGDGSHFPLYKFRTMSVNAEKGSGPVWAKKNDPRRTKIGTLLRENNLDELPQLWNVFVGDMSLVGPRPERPHFVSQFKEDIPRYMARHSIRSGITGWAQVNGLRGDTSIEERTKYDLYYIENWSLFLDFKILFLTMFARRNAY